MVLVIDDLHWADPATVKLWGRLARTAHQVPLLLIGITRPVPQREDLLALRRAVDDEHRVQLGSLAQPAVAELVGTLAGGRPDTGLLRLAAGAAGNPLYLTEMLAALARSGGISVTPTGTAQLAAGTVPDSLPGAIADRLGFVSASDQGGAPRGGAARRRVRDHRPDRRARQEPSPPWSPRSTRPARPGCWPIPAAASRSAIR